MSGFLSRLNSVRGDQQDQWEVRWTTFHSFGLHNTGPEKHVEVFDSKQQAQEFSALLYEAAKVLKQQFWESPTLKKQERV